MSRRTTLREVADICRVLATLVIGTALMFMGAFALIDGNWTKGLLLIAVSEILDAVKVVRP